MTNIYQSLWEKAKKSKLDKVDKDELDGDFDDREDKDIDNDGDEDKSDKYLHGKRKKVSIAINAKKGKSENPDDSEKEIEESVLESIADACEEMGIDIEDLSEEQIDELSRNTLKSYAKKANSDMHKNFSNARGEQQKHDNALYRDDAEEANKTADGERKYRKKAWSRAKNIQKAKIKTYGKQYMVGEETLDELSKKTLGSYVTKASGDRANNAFNLATMDKGDKRTNAWGKDFKRTVGIKKAVKKLITKEETLDELSKKTLQKYVDKSHKKSEKAINSYSNAANRRHDFAPDTPAMTKNFNLHMKRSDGTELAKKKLGQHNVSGQNYGTVTDRKKPSVKNEETLVEKLLDHSHLEHDTYPGTAADPNSTFNKIHDAAHAEIKKHVEKSGDKGLKIGDHSKFMSSSKPHAIIHNQMVKHGIKPDFETHGKISRSIGKKLASSVSEATLKLTNEEIELTSTQKLNAAVLRSLTEKKADKIAQPDDNANPGDKMQKMMDVEVIDMVPASVNSVLAAGRAGPGKKTVKEETLDENSRADHYKGATQGQTWRDNASQAEKDFYDMHMKGAKWDDTEEKGHIDALKAGRAGPGKKARKGDNTNSEKMKKTTASEAFERHINDHVSALTEKYLNENKDKVTADFGYWHDGKDGPKDVEGYVKNVGTGGHPSLTSKITKANTNQGREHDCTVTGHVKHVMKFINDHHQENYSLDHAGHKQFNKDYS